MGDWNEGSKLQIFKILKPTRLYVNQQNIFLMDWNVCDL